MKKTILTFAIFSVIANFAALGVAPERAGNPFSAERIASNMIQSFDSDESAALNKLELAGALEYLSEARPYVVDYLDFISSGDEQSAPPQIAYGLVEGFDSNSDYQLTKEELSLAISYLRRLNRDGMNTLAIAG